MIMITTLLYSKWLGVKNSCILTVSNSKGCMDYMEERARDMLIIVV